MSQSDKEKLSNALAWGRFKHWVLSHLRAEADKTLVEDDLEEFRGDNKDLTISEAMAKLEKPKEANQTEVDLHLAIEWEVIWAKEQDVAKLQEKAKEVREALASGVVSGEDVGLFRSETRIIKNPKKWEKERERLELEIARLKGEAPKPPTVPLARPSFEPTADEFTLLKNLFVNQLILRGFSERFATTEFMVAKEDLLKEIKVARDFVSAKTLVTEFAKSYRIIPRPSPQVAAPSPTPAITGAAPIPYITEIQGRSPIDGKPMESLRFFPFGGLVWRLKEGLRLYREQEPAYETRNGERVFRSPKYFLWDPATGIHREVSLDELTQRNLAAPGQIERVETKAARAYKMYLNQEPDITRRLGLSDQRLQEIVAKGKKEGVVALYEEVD